MGKHISVDSGLILQAKNIYESNFSVICQAADCCEILFFLNGIKHVRSVHLSLEVPSYLT